MQMKLNEYIEVTIYVSFTNRHNGSVNKTSLRTDINGVKGHYVVLIAEWSLYRWSY